MPNLPRYGKPPQTYLDMVNDPKLAPAEFFPLVVVLVVELAFLKVNPRHLKEETGVKR